MSITHGDGTRSAIAVTVMARCVGGSLALLDADLNVLVSMNLLATPFFLSGTGVITSNAIPPANVTRAGTATTYEIRDSMGARVFGGTVGLSGADLTMSMVTLAVDDPVIVDTITYASPV